MYNRLHIVWGEQSEDERGLRGRHDKQKNTATTTIYSKQLREENDDQSRGKSFG